MRTSSVKKIFKYVLIGFLSIIVLLLVWGVLIEPRFYSVSEETVEIPNLPAEFENKQIALIADLQVGMWFNNTDTIKEIVGEIARRRPAAVLIAGDFVYRPTDDDDDTMEVRNEASEDREDIRAEIEKVINLLRPLSDAKIPVYAVLGNHDYAMEKRKAVKLEWVADELEKSLEKSGVKILRNEAVPVAPPKTNSSVEKTDSGSELFIAGIDSLYAGRAAAAAALRSVPGDAPRIFLMHHPELFAELPENSAPLAVAAHTHGGQIRLPFTPEWSWLSFKTEGEARADGWIDDFGKKGNRLYVNRGIGFSLFPIRINCLPELTIFTLKRGKN